MNALTYVREKLDWMEVEGIWPNGLRYLWTDAFGLVLLVSLHAETGEKHYLDSAESLVAEVNRVLGRARGLRIGEAPDRDGQYFHYLAMWLYALSVLGRYRPAYLQQGIEIVHQVHDAFVDMPHGVFWKMSEDLSAPYPGFGYGALDAFDGYVSYRMLDESGLAREIGEMHQLMNLALPDLWITQDLGIGMMLWMSHFFPEEDWAREQRNRCLGTLEHLWVGDGYFCREPGYDRVRFAFTNYGISIGLQAVGAMPGRVAQLHEYFGHYHAGDNYDRDPITHVMGCCAHFPGFLLRDFKGGHPHEE